MYKRTKLHPIFTLVFYMGLLVSGILIQHKVDAFFEEYNYYKKVAYQIEKVTNKIPKQYRAFVVDMCDKYDVPIMVLYKLIDVESNWNRFAIGRRNNNGTRDYGIAQLNSRYMKGFVRSFYTGRKPFNVYNVRHSLEVSIKLLAMHYNTFKNWYKTVCAYNAGSNAVRRNRIPVSTKVYAERIINNNYI